MFDYDIEFASHLVDDAHRNLNMAYTQEQYFYWLDALRKATDLLLSLLAINLL